MSRAKYALGMSGFIGLVVGLTIGLYQALLSDPMLLGGAQPIAEWMIGVHVHFIGLSLIVLFFSWYVDPLFGNRSEAAAAGGILGQWLVPGGLGAVYVTGIGPFGIAILVGALAMVATILAFCVQYVRLGPIETAR